MAVHEPSDDDANQRLNAVVLVIAMMAVGFLFWLVAHIHHNVLYQNCHMAGFRDCTGDQPIITPPHRRDKF